MDHREKKEDALSLRSASTRPRRRTEEEEEEDEEEEEVDEEEEEDDKGGPLDFDWHGDTMDLFLMGWDAEPLRLLLHAVLCKVVDAPNDPTDNDGARLREAILVLDHPMLGEDNVMGGKTFYLTDAMRRFASTTLPPSEAVVMWRRALLLLVFWLSQQFRTLLLGQSAFTDNDCRTRTPSRPKNLRFLSAIRDPACAFQTSAPGERDPAHLVRTARSLWLTDSPHYLLDDDDEQHVPQ